MRSAFVSGVGQSDVGKLPDSTCMGLHLQVAADAIDDAGLAWDAIDGVLCAYSFTEPHMMLSSVFCELAGLRPTYTAALQVGGASACIMAITAAALVESGQCRHVLCVTGDNRLTGMAPGQAAATLAAFGHPVFEQPYGSTIPASYALVATRYMHEYGLTSEQLAAIATTARAHAALHPQAHRRTPITIADVLASAMIATPLHLLDCCPVSDGAAAVVISDGAAARDLRRAAVTIAGSGQGHTHEHVFAAPSLTDFGCKQAASLALSRAGLTVADIDVAEIYDSFTITLAVELESMGFFARGEAGHAAARGDLTFGGRLPCNTHGGLLSFGHSGAAGGMFHLVEAVRQLRGEGGERQVAGARTAFVHGDGGVLSAHASMVLTT